jgi:hypothetical protein
VPLKGEGGTTGGRDARGAHAPPPTFKASCAASPCTSSTRVEGGANGGTVVTRHSGLVPQGVSNLGEALATICSLVSFPPMPGALAYKPWEAHLQELSEYVQCCPIAVRHGSSPLIREIGAATAPDGGTTRIVAREVAAGLAMAFPVQPAAAPTWPTTSVVMLGRLALATEVPAPVMSGAMVITLCHLEERHGAAMHHQQERHKPTQRVQTPPGMASAAARNRASKCTLEKPLAIEPGPVAMAERRAGAGAPVGVAPGPTSRKWCPLHETSLHNVTACRYIGCLAKCAAKGVTHGCYECG